MSDEFEKYAVYWVPAGGDAFTRFGASWTGWCAERGEIRPRGKFHGLSSRAAVRTRDSGRHGFHGVIKAPFRLAAGCSRFLLEHALREVADDALSFHLPRLSVAVIDGCVSLTPREDCPALRELVSRVDHALAQLDASASAGGFAEAAAPERLVANGSGPVVQLPAAGVHRFRMPLTVPLKLDVAFAVLGELRPLLESMLDEPRRLQDLALMGDPGGGRPLRVLQRYDLREAPARKATHALPCTGPHVLVQELGNRLARHDIAV